MDYLLTLTTGNPTEWHPLSEILRGEHIKFLKNDYCFWDTHNDPAFVLDVGKNLRYGSILAGLHVSCRSKEGEAAKQFSATTFRLPDKTHFVAFRGTDLSLAGWREDFDMLYEESIPSLYSMRSPICVSHPNQTQLPACRATPCTGRPQH